MSTFLSIEGWQVLDGHLSPVVHSFNTWGQSNVAFSSPVNDYVFPHSQTAENLFDFSGIDEPMFIGGFDIEKTGVENYVIPVEQHVHVLPTTPEEGYLSDYQIRQIAPLLQSVEDFSPIGSQHIDVQEYAVPSSSEQKYNFADVQSFSPWHVMLEAENEGAALSDAQIAGNSDDVDVMDMLSQLCDTIDGDMIIDQAEMTAFDSFLLPMSPEDVDSLLSDSPTCVTHSPVSSSLFTATSWPPSSPMSDSDSSSSTDLPGVVPHVVKKQRKKEQNKTAALRYREKKRSEHGSVMTECEMLESRNSELKTKVSDMMKEIDYLKGLIAEILA